MRVLVVRHHDIDEAGFIEAAFVARGAEITVHLVPDDGPLPPLDGVDHIVLLGAVCPPGGTGPSRSASPRPSAPRVRS